MIRYYSDVGYRIAQIRVSARKQRLDFCEDDVPHFKKILRQSCSCCGISPTTERPLLGLNRVVSLDGYHRVNVVSCCKECNL